MRYEPSSFYFVPFSIFILNLSASRNRFFSLDNFEDLLRLRFSFFDDGSSASTWWLDSLEVDGNGAFVWSLFNFLKYSIKSFNCLDFFLNILKSKAYLISTDSENPLAYSYFLSVLCICTRLCFRYVSGQAIHVKTSDLLRNLRLQQRYIRGWSLDDMLPDWWSPGSWITMLNLIPYFLSSFIDK